MNDERLTVLVNHYLDRQLSGDERSELEELLRQSATARTQFWSEARMHALLHEAEKGALPLASAGPALRFPRRRVLAAWFAAVAAVASVMIWATGSWQEGPARQPGEETTTAIAVLSRALDAHWRSASESHAVGAALEPGWLHLASGLVQIEFHNGVRMVVEGPSDVRLVSANETLLSVGRLHAEVPAVARGFIVRTPRLEVVDLGTAFGVAVTGSLEEVHVFQGTVTLQAATGPAQALHGGQAMSLSGGVGLAAIIVRPSAFPSAADLERQTVTATDQRLQRWRQASARWDADPALAVRFDFARDTISDRTMRNVSRPGAITAPATIIGCTSAEGRWPGKSALAFRNQNDRVRLLVPGEHRSMTTVAWVCVEALERPFNSLFMTDAFALGALHWQIRGDGSLHLGISGPRGQPGEKYNFDVPGVFTTDRFGQWLQVAMVYDGARRQLTQYVDGRPVGRSRLIDDIVLRIGQGELGNWNPGATSDETPIRNLSGRMDEFALFTRALADQEIMELYRSGSPATAAGP